jgi:hypothetical protein
MDNEIWYDGMRFLPNEIERSPIIIHHISIYDNLLDSRLRGNDIKEIPASAGMTSNFVIPAQAGIQKTIIDREI